MSFLESRTSLLSVQGASAFVGSFGFRVLRFWGFGVLGFFLAGLGLLKAALGFGDSVKTVADLGFRAPATTDSKTQEETRDCGKLSLLR